MSSEEYLKDISEIKTLMSKSSKFISLSGLSGILAGIYALIGAGYAYWLFHNTTEKYIYFGGELFYKAFIALALVTILSIGSAILLTTKKAKLQKQKIWDPLTRRLLFNFLLPLFAGGIYTVIILSQEKYGQTAALMLLFYGLALFSASKYTLGDVKYLGITQIILGLLCAIFPSYGFWFWVIGFGFMHIIYGTIMYFKYDRKS